MESKVFVQVSTINRKRFTLEDETLLVETKGFLSERAVRVTYDSLAASPIEFSVSSKYSFWFMIILLGFALFSSLMWVFGATVQADGIWIFLILGLLFATRFILSRHRFVAYRAGAEIVVFYKDLPNPEEFKSFISALHTRKREFIKSNLLSSAANTISEIERKLSILIDRGVLTTLQGRGIVDEVIHEHSLNPDDGANLN